MTTTTTLDVGSIVLGRHRVDAHLALGALSTSVVWRGTDLEDGSEVAIKEYQTLPVGDWGELNLCENEARVHRDLADCPGLVPMLAYDERTIVKRFAPGDTLADTPHHGRTYARRMLAAIMAAVSYAAERGHGDLHHALAEDNWITDGEAFVCVDLCSMVQSEWSERTNELVCLALGAHREYEHRYPITGWYRQAPRWRQTTARARLSRLREIDDELADAIVVHAGDPVAMAARLGRMA